MKGTHNNSKCVHRKTEKLIERKRDLLVSKIAMILIINRPGVAGAVLQTPL